VSLTCDHGSFDPEAENTCERLIKLALEVDENNVEALQTLASVRLSQQKPDEARKFLERAWSGWKDLDLGA
jgi:cytochrome c-type biogenesis protein CcmH/NrfG